MNRYFLFLTILISLLHQACSEKINPEIKATTLHCEYMEDALTVKTLPRFSWQVESSQQGQKQTAWQVIVSDSKELAEAGKGNIWDSGKNKNRETFGIKWKGSRLKSLNVYYWRVRIWDKDGMTSDWSKTAQFTTGAFDKKDWKASWIGDQPEKPLDYPLHYKHIGYLSSYAATPNEEKWIQVDLGESKSFNTISLYPSYENKREITDYYFPGAYRIEVSNDAKKWESIVDEDKASSPGGNPVIHSFDDVSARFVRITATQLKKYDHINFNPDDRENNSRYYAFSLAELEVADSNNIVSLNSNVSCKDALVKIDREDGYDPDMICDGMTNTPEPPKRRSIPPSPLLRKTIELKEKPVKAVAFVSALGLYEIAFNAQQPDQRVLAPEWTDYNKRVQYQAYNVSDKLVSGTNVITAQLGDGWYAGMLGPVRWSPYYPKRGAYGLNRRLFFQMEVEYANGEKETFISDGSWKIQKNGPIQKADNFIGETYDANKELKGWQTAVFNDSGWENVTADNLPDINLVPQINQPVRVIETLPAKSVTKTKDGNYIFDVGQNIAGWCRIKLEGNPGDIIVLQHGEILDEEGELYTENLGMAVQIDTVILGSSGKLVYEPRFTYHGFRFVEVKGLQNQPDKNILEAKVIASDQPRTGYFECSNPLLNQLYKNINRSHVSNMHGVPTDCPQRDERCGWMGDAFIFAQTSIYNRDMAAFYSKWITDIIDAQTERGTFPDIAPHPFAYEKHFTGVPGWADAGIQVPVTLYQNYGDTEILEIYFDAYERYIKYLEKINPDFIWENKLGNNYGDWLNGNTLRAEGFPTTGAQIPSEVFATIMYYNSTCNLVKMAKAIGKKDKANYYSELASNIKEAFTKTFVSPEGIIDGDAQACYAMALYYGIYPEKLEDAMEKRMIEKFIPYDGRMNTGFHSTLPLMKELVKRGYEDKAFQLLETTEFPSWGYSIEQGATSIWERWDGYVKGRGVQGAGMNSFNHYAFGAVGEWMYQNILGIQPDDNNPGFTHFILKPMPKGTLTRAKGSYNSISGKIETEWEKNDNQFKYDFTIPANTSARIYIPSENSENITINGETLPDIMEKTDFEFADNYTSFELPSGKYKVKSTL